MNTFPTPRMHTDGEIENLSLEDYLFEYDSPVCFTKGLKMSSKTKDKSLDDSEEKKEK